MKNNKIFFDKESKILLLISLICLIGIIVTLIVSYHLFPDGNFNNFSWFILIGFIVFFIFSFLSYVVRIIKNK